MSIIFLVVVVIEVFSLAALVRRNMVRGLIGFQNVSALGLMLLVILVDVVKWFFILFIRFSLDYYSASITFLLLTFALILFVLFLGSRLITRKVFEVKQGYNSRSFPNLGRVRTFDNQGVTVFRVEAVLVILFFLLGWLRVGLLGYLAHDFVKTICANGFDSFLVVEFIDWNTFVLKRKEEEQHLVDLLFLQMLLLLRLAQLEPLLFNRHQQV
jgi:hypothetical protein